MSLRARMPEWRLVRSWVTDRPRWVASWSSVGGVCRRCVRVLVASSMVCRVRMRRSRRRRRCGLMGFGGVVGWCWNWRCFCTLLKVSAWFTVSVDVSVGVSIKPSKEASIAPSKRAIAAHSASRISRALFKTHLMGSLLTRHEAPPRGGGADTEAHPGARTRSGRGLRNAMADSKQSGGQGGGRCKEGAAVEEARRGERNAN